MMKRVLAAACVASVMLGSVGAVLALSPATAPQPPAHFSITQYADLSTGFGPHSNPSAIAVGADGLVYVATDYGRVYAFEDTNGDDQQDTFVLFAEGLYFASDLAWHGEDLYVVVPEQVRVLHDLDYDGDALSGTENERFVGGLPETTRGVAIDSSDRVYVSVAAGCDACTPADTRQGTIIRYSSTGTGELVFAVGLHDAADLDFYPGTAHLFAADDGRDDLGPTLPPDEWNFIQQGRSYGWPHCWLGGSDPGWSSFCTWATGPLASFAAHSSPAGVAFHDGTAMPAAFAGNAFVALSGLDAVYRVIVTATGPSSYSATAQAFATGFDEPIDVAVGPDGAIYVAEHNGYGIYCIRALPNVSGSSKRAGDRSPELGDTLTYTLRVVAAGPGTAFTLTDRIPARTTYVSPSAWASTGTISYAGGLVTWYGTVGANATVSATFAVQVSPSAPTRTVIINTAVLTGEEDAQSPYNLRSIVFVNPVDVFLPQVARNTP